MTQSVFGVGYLFTIPSVAIPTPIKFGRLQDVAVDFSFESKPLYGSNQYAVEVARGKAKIDIKATDGSIDPVLFNTIFWGDTATIGETLNSVDELGTVPASSTFTVSAANAANFSTDLGVLDSTTGLYLTRIISSPTAGSYSVSTAGVYTFASGAASHVVKLNYTYASPSTGFTVTGNNQLMGSQPTFALDLVNKYIGADGKVRSLYMNFPVCMSDKLSMAFKLDDWELPQLDFTPMDNGSGNIWNFTATSG